MNINDEKNFWETPTLTEFRPALRYHGATCPTEPISSRGGDNCPDGTQADEG